MSILLGRETKVVIQGITSEFAGRQAAAMIRYGTRVVAGVTPGRGGQIVNGVPVFDTMAEAVLEHRADATAIFVGPSGIKDAVMEAVTSGVKLIFVTADNLPIKDVLILRGITRRHGVWMMGPNSMGLITPGQALIGAFEPAWVRPGRVGVMSRGGSFLLYTSRILTAKRCLAATRSNTCRRSKPTPIPMPLSCSPK